MTKKSPAGELSGTVSSITLSSLIQMLSWEKCNSTISIFALEGKGCLYFNEGELIDAETLDLQGVEAAYSICSWHSPVMTISPCMTRPRRIQLSVPHILLKASQFQDEQSEPSQPDNTSAQNDLLEHQFHSDSIFQDTMIDLPSPENGCIQDDLLGQAAPAGTIFRDDLPDLLAAERTTAPDNPAKQQDLEHRLFRDDPFDMPAPTGAIEQGALGQYPTLPDTFCRDNLLEIPSPENTPIQDDLARQPDPAGTFFKNDQFDLLPPAGTIQNDQRIDYQEELEILRGLTDVAQCAITDKHGNILARSTNNLKFESLLRYGILTGKEMQNLLECKEQGYISITTATPGIIYLIPEQDRTLCIHFNKETSQNQTISEIKSALSNLQGKRTSWNT